MDLDSRNYCGGNIDRCSALKQDESESEEAKGAVSQGEHISLCRSRMIRGHNSKPVKKSAFSKHLVQTDRQAHLLSRLTTLEIDNHITQQQRQLDRNAKFNSAWNAS